MIGDGDLRNSIESEITQRSLSDEVVLLGWQTQDQVREHMQKADLFLMTSHHGEGWGLVVNEALSFGCGVIANQQLGSASCLVEQGVSGVLYSDHNFNQKLDHIATLGRDRMLLMGKAGNARMRESWSSQVAARRTIGLSKALLREMSGAELAGHQEASKHLYASGIAKLIA